MSRMKKILFVFYIFISLFFCASCIRQKLPEENPSFVWEKFSYKDYNGYLYVTLNAENGELLGILCADISGIKGRLRLNHVCTEEQFKNLKNNLCDMGATYLGAEKTPDFSDYPDLSMYLTFVISHDELDEIWQKLGLE